MAYLSLPMRHTPTNVSPVLRATGQSTSRLGPLPSQSRPAPGFKTSFLVNSWDRTLLKAPSDGLVLLEPRQRRFGKLDLVPRD